MEVGLAWPLPPPPIVARNNISRFIESVKPRYAGTLPQSGRITPTGLIKTGNPNDQAVAVIISGAISVMPCRLRSGRARLGICPPVGMGGIRFSENLIISRAGAA